MVDQDTGLGGARNRPELPPYDASRRALYHPGEGATGFLPGRRYSLSACCAELARLAYVAFEDDRACALRELCATGRLTLCGILAVAGSQGFVVKDEGGTAYVAFRGTEAGDPTDLATDAAAELVPHGRYQGRVHAGFAAAYECVAADLAALLGRVDPRHLVLTGHSLGAALATLAASQFGAAQLVTLGSPAVGNRAFADSIAADRVQRYVGCCDVVTELPPEWLGFRHVGSMRYIDRHSHVHDAAPDGAALLADRQAARLEYLRTYAWRLGNVGVRDLTDHAPANYVRALLGAGT